MSSQPAPTTRYPLALAFSAALLFSASRPRGCCACFLFVCRRGSCVVSSTTSCTLVSVSEAGSQGVCWEEDLHRGELRFACFERHMDWWLLFGFSATQSGSSARGRGHRQPSWETKIEEAGSRSALRLTFQRLIAPGHLDFLSVKCLKLFATKKLSHQALHFDVFALPGSSLSCSAFFLTLQIRQRACSYRVSGFGHLRGLCSSTTSHQYLQLMQQPLSWPWYCHPEAFEEALPQTWERHLHHQKPSLRALTLLRVNKATALCTIAVQWCDVARCGCFVCEDGESQSFAWCEGFGISEKAAAWRCRFASFRFKKYIHVSVLSLFVAHLEFVYCFASEPHFWFPVTLFTISAPPFWNSSPECR